VAGKFPNGRTKVDFHFNLNTMKTLSRSSYISFSVIFIFLLTISCKKSDSTSVPRENGPVITGVGTNAGTPSDTLIGPAGGTLHSADGKLTVTVPANALPSVTTISIQPITNMAPQGLGSGYRLMPEGTTFAKAVTLTFHYDNDLLHGSLEDFLWIVTQVGNGSWNAMLKSALDKNARTVTVTTTHFSDWMLGKFIDLTLTPAAANVQRGQSVALRVGGFSRDKALADDAELAPLIFLAGAGDDLTPLTPVPPVESRLMDFKIKQWTMNGSPAPVSNSNGSLTASGNSATYTAPAQVPAINPAAVTVQLQASNKEGGQFNFLVTSNITVIQDDLYVKVKIDGQPYQYTQYGFNQATPPDPDNFTQVICGLTGDKLEIMASFLSTTGPVKNNFILNFTNPMETTKTLVGSNKNGDDDLSFMLMPGTSYELNYEQRILNQGTCERVSLCGSATATLLSYSASNPLVTGYFSGTIYEDKPTFFDNCTTPISHTIEGEFRVMRGN
jgi:hypothetical protein